MANRFEQIFKRIFLGKPVDSKKVKSTLLSKRIALPVFASDALSSVAYAPNEILLTLSLAGVGMVAFAPYVGFAVVFVLVVVVLSYTQNVKAYPSGGGDYEVVSTNLGKKAGLIVGSSLVVDYFLTVAVSIASGVEYVISVLPSLSEFHVVIAVAVVLFIMLMNLRGVKESGTFFAIPVYFFILSVISVVVVGFFKSATGTLGMAESNQLTLIPSTEYSGNIYALAAMLLFARAFASGCAALTGVEAICNGVPSFKEPKPKNASQTLLILGCISSFMMISILVLSQITGVKYVEDPTTQLMSNGQFVGKDYNQLPAIGQLAQTVFSSTPIVFILVSVATGLILFLAANTAFNGFPVLASVLAKDKYLPHYMMLRGDRLAFSNGILILAGGASLLLILFDASVTRLIQLYVVGVFISFTLSQLSMVLHWCGRIKAQKTIIKLKEESKDFDTDFKAMVTDLTKEARRTKGETKKQKIAMKIKLLRLYKTSDVQTMRKQMRQMALSRVINVIGFSMTAIVLCIVLFSKFLHGAYISVILIGFVFCLTTAIKKYYSNFSAKLKYDPKKDSKEKDLSVSDIHAIVLVSGITKPVIRALKYARATSPNYLEAILVDAESENTKKVKTYWKNNINSIPLHILASPYRSIVRPVERYIYDLHQTTDDLIVVFIPEPTATHKHDKLMHSHTSYRLKTRLSHFSKVIIASVPWQIDESADAVPEKRPIGYQINSIRTIFPERKDAMKKNAYINESDEIEYRYGEKADGTTGYIRYNKSDNEINISKDASGGITVKSKKKRVVANEEGEGIIITGKDVQSDRDASESNNPLINKSRKKKQPIQYLKSSSDEDTNAYLLESPDEDDNEEKSLDSPENL